MSPLNTEFHRLFLFPPGPALPGTLLDAQGRTRALVLELIAPVDTAALGALWQGLQTELGMPAPAVAVNGRDALQLWCSLAQPVSLGQARAFLEGLVARYLPDGPARQWRAWPVADAAAPGGVAHVSPIPAEQPGGECWSAFVSPDLAPVFAETPWLDIPPRDEAQAGLLRGLSAISPAAWAEAMAQLAPAAPAGQADTVEPFPVQASATPPGVGPAAEITDPRAFLQAVMCDARVPLALRIEAAKALLPGTPGAPAADR
ncbi:hypothetical protein KGA65_04725 [Ideonella sp. B7]|uniref:hypothetical protein n=1 Tax=Ideonella benzenivorans TaxID=2831643 RepID=UPI001CEDB331|nr:hypothetical protein [Ideonella benzenivorans]MCA6215846.1 hypothetical protein [Ideonella benzenivorans]